MEMTTTYDNEPDTSIAPSHVESSDDGWRVSKVLMGGKERKGTEGKLLESRQYVKPLFAVCQCLTESL
jgi:hypothetical protein